MTAQGGDLLAWLDNAISVREAAARKATAGVCPDWVSSAVRHVARNCQIECSHDDHQGFDQPEWGRYDDSPHIILNSPESVLRRCAADRKLLELHGDRYHSCPAKSATGYLDEWTQFNYGDTCPVVLLLAEGYGWTGGER
jgi:hypothetical protein